MYTPTLAQARKLVGSARFVPMYREILADLETPVSAYLKYGAGRDSCLSRDLPKRQFRRAAALHDPHQCGEHICVLGLPSSWTHATFRQYLNRCLV